MRDPPPAQTASATPHTSRRPPAAADLPSGLIGRLPCVGCGYELQGLSVLGNCPECGAAVRATILAVVDPLADELRPIHRPRLVAAGLILWTFMSLLAVLSGAAATAIAYAYGSQGLGAPPWLVMQAPRFIAVELWIAGAGALLLCSPHRSVGAAHVLLAIVGALAYAPLGLVALRLSEQAIDAATAGRLDLWFPRPDRTILRVAACIIAIVIIGSLRPVARVLVARSLALRTGRVDRQTMMAVAGASAVIAIGDTLGFFAPGAGTAGGGGGGSVYGSPWEFLRTIGAVVMILGGALLTLGLAGALVDAVRIAAAVVAPSPGIRQVLRAPAAAPAAVDAPTTGGGR